jgi:hypothetical protein
MRLVGFRGVLAFALALGVFAPAAMPSTVAASGRTCQSVWYNFTYRVYDQYSGGQWAMTTAQLKATGCWNSSQTWNTDLKLYTVTGAHIYQGNQAQPTPYFAPNWTTNFWSNDQIQFCIAQVVTDQGTFCNGWSYYGVAPRIYLNPSSSTTFGNWSSASITICGANANYVGPCYGTAGTRVAYTSTWAG